MKAEIATTYEPGRRYRSVRDIAIHYRVSQQTALRAARELCARGLLEARDRSGLYYPTLRAAPRIGDQPILVVSANPDPRFNEAFLNGIEQECARYGVTVEPISVRENPASLEFGQQIFSRYTERNAAGVIALAFRNADLAFYHLLSNGVVLISDVDSHGLPMLPSLQSDNRRHSAEAAKTMASRKKSNMLIVGYWPPGNSRHQSFEETFNSLVPAGSCRYVHLADDMAIADLYMFFHRFAASDGVFVIDYAANHTVAPYFLSHDVPTDGNLIVYDSEYETFSFNRLPPIHAAAPSLHDLGVHLARKLIARLRSGSWPDPLRERI